MTEITRYGCRSAPLFSGATLDRAFDLRDDPTKVSHLLSSPDSVALVATVDQVLMDLHDAHRLLRVPLTSLPRELIDANRLILLGIDSGRAVLGLDIGDSRDLLERPDLSQGKLSALREVGTTLDRADGALAAYLVGLLGWHRRHRFCSNCGEHTKVTDAGISRLCPRCDAKHFPRIDPVVIMLVERDGQLLLGRRPSRPENRYSMLAGFVTCGETPEEAVVREVREEAGIQVHSPRYVAAQPWPFPSSLVLGFEVTADHGTVSVPDGEMLETRWFTLPEIAQAQQGSVDLLLPRKVSIARFLIDAWVTRGGKRL